MPLTITQSYATWTTTTVKWVDMTDKLAQKRKQNEANYTNFLSLILDNPDIWNNTNSIAKIDLWMIHAYEEADCLLKILEGRTHLTPIQLAEFITGEWILPSFKLCVFHKSFFQMYHVARNRVITRWDVTGLFMNFVAPESFAKTHQEPFFINGTPEYQWRMLFNELCERFEKLRVLPHLDQDYRDWIKPDYDEYLANSIPRCPLTREDVLLS